MKRIILLMVFALLLASCELLELPSDQPVQDVGSISVHFCPVEDCEAIIIQELNASEKIFCAFYDFGLEEVEEVLRDKRAEVLIFDENKEEWPFTPVKSLGLMHDKFCVLDPGTGRDTVITGSMNPTNNGAYKNDNNILIIESAVIAENYLDEFAELKVRGKNPTRNTHVNLSGTLVENYFCPEDDCEGKVLKLLEQAQDEILFMTFTFTSDPIGQLLARKSREGVGVRGIFEARQRSQYWEYEKLEAATANITTDGNPQTMHHKVFIIDPDTPPAWKDGRITGATVITGSYNPTKAGTTKNDENVIVIHDEGIARQFVTEFERVWNQAS